MEVFSLYSNREKRNGTKQQDVYQYDNVPQSLRVQIVHVLHDAIGTYENKRFGNPKAEEIYKSVHDAVAREYGVFNIGSTDHLYETRIVNVILKESNLDLFFDVYQLLVQIIDKYIRETYNYKHEANTSLSPNDAVEELNFRFREAAFGYEYVDGLVIRIDSQHIHSEIIKPALVLLADNMYEGANDEFRKAFDEYRKGGAHNKDALVEALKSFESTMKAICQKHGWMFNPTDTASILIKVITDNKLLPIWQQNGLTGIRTTLESIASPRNKMGGHGQGSSVVVVPDYYVRYALNSTASAIILLAEAEKLLST